MAEKDPDLAKQALAGLRRYQETRAAAPRRERPVVQQFGGASLRDCGGTGPVAILIPSLINPPDILDLDDGSSLADALSTSCRVLLLDWGPAQQRRDLDLSAHVTQLLLPLVEAAGPATLVGYCLGGTLALAAAALSSSVEAVATLAAPWDFAAYDPAAVTRLQKMLAASSETADWLGGLPMEVLQSAFWSLDPQRTVAKFASFAAFEAGSAEERRFIALEEWANGGEPLPLPAARELVDQLFACNLTAKGEWLGGGLPTCPQLHVTASTDRIVPGASAAPGEQLQSAAGHVGMIVGRQAPELLHRPLRSWLEAFHKHR